MVRHGSATPSSPVQIWVAPPEKRLFFGIVFFQLYLPSASYIATQLYSTLSSGIVLRTVKGKYNITETVSFNITFALQKYHSNEVGISLKAPASILNVKARKKDRFRQRNLSFFRRYKSRARFSICLADSICAIALDMLPCGNEIYIISSFE